MKKERATNRAIIKFQNKIGISNFILLLSMLIGFAAGISAIVLKNSVFFIEHLLSNIYSQKYGNFFYVISPTIGLILTIVFCKYLLRRKLEHGIPMVLSAISTKGGKIAPHNMFSSIIASALTVGFGGSVGLEGPAVSTGAAIGSNVGSFFNLSYKQIVLLTGAAVSGAIAAIFKAPITGVLFAIEIIMIDLTMSSLVPLLIASCTGAITSYFLLGQNVIFHFNLRNDFNLKNIIFYIILGVVCGFGSIYYTKFYIFIKKLFKPIKKQYHRLLIGGVLLGLLIFILPPLYGEGYDDINSCLLGQLSFVFNNSLFTNYENITFVAILLLFSVFVFKIVATSLTFNAGGVGGIFAPTLFAGAFLGLCYASFISFIDIRNLPFENFSLAGMTGMMAGVMHAPLTAIFLIAEVTNGYNLFVPLIITSTISFIISKFFIPYSLNTIQLADRGELHTHHKDNKILTLMRIDNLIEKDFSPVDINGCLGDVIKVIPNSTRSVFPVVDNDNNFYGVVFINDIRKDIFNKEVYNTIKVKDILIKPTLTVRSDESMSNIAKKFENSNLYNVPVVDDGKYIGFVSRANVFSEYRNINKAFSEE